MHQPEQDAFTDYCSKSVEEIQKTEQAAAEPTATAEIPKPRTASMPPCHRALNPNEPLRRGDKGRPESSQEWEQIPERIRGDAAWVHYDEYGVFCRPMPPEANVWYVAEHGTPDACGSPDDPFNALENARQRIEQSCRQLGLEPCGLILDFELNVLFAYDPPEPEAASGNDAEEDPLPVPEGYYQIKRLTRIQENDLMEQDGEWVSASHLVGKQASYRRIARKKHKNDPRQNTRGEENGLEELTAAIKELTAAVREITNVMRPESHGSRNANPS